MASMRDIKRRKTSIQSTQQITKAMKLVSTVKLQRAKARAEQSKNYTMLMYDTIVSITNRSGYIDHKFMNPNGSDKKAVILITSNRGLAGGYNNNIFKLLKAETEGKTAKIITVGKKMTEHAKKHGYDIIMSFPSIENLAVADTYEIGKKVNEMFRAGEINEVNVIYTRYISMLLQQPTVKELLPISECGEKPRGEMLIEPGAGEVLSAIIPEYISGMTYGAVCESFASELSARRNAMDNASKNAEEMIETLELRYNRARQSAITQEITEIIGGSES